MAVRRQSQGFSRGTSTFRGVTHHPSGGLQLLTASCMTGTCKLYHVTISALQSSSWLSLSQTGFEMRLCGILRRPLGSAHRRAWKQAHLSGPVRERG